MHGRRGQASWADPQMVTECHLPNRKDQGNTTASHEYLDDPAVLQEKVAMLAELLRQAKCCCAYTGAGLSKSSGIPDYATKAQNSVANVTAKPATSYQAAPTYAHHALVELHRQGLLHCWVQQNHDGLPQKAGFPQEQINEIHGAWFDPSNPVVKFSGSLRGDLFDDMERMEQEVDLCLCLGTSLSGMNADRMAHTPAEKFAEGVGLGTVVVNLQRTKLDATATLRIWARLDDVFRALARALGVKVDPKRFSLAGIPDVVVVPYDKDGKHSVTETTTWDLRVRSAVVVAHPNASNRGAKGTISSHSDYAFVISFENGINRHLGKWWVTSALAGRVPYLPVVNVRPPPKRTASAPRAQVAPSKPV
eukprot:EG_transcript_12417